MKKRVAPHPMVDKSRIPGPQIEKIGITIHLFPGESKLTLSIPAAGKHISIRIVAAVERDFPLAVGELPHAL